MSECNKVLMAANQAHPRTCAKCGLGPCIHDPVSHKTGAEGVQSPMGWFYRVDRVGDNAPVVYRCKLGSAWERPEVYDIAEFTPAELRFVADVIDASKTKAA